MSIVPLSRAAVDPLACPAWCNVDHAGQAPNVDVDLAEYVQHTLSTRLIAPGSNRPMSHTVEGGRFDVIDRLGGVERGRVGIVVDGQSDDPLTAQEARDLAAALLEMAAIVGGEQ